jgi:carbohydrate kinase (thermoresistant glucokinase family)
VTPKHPVVIVIMGPAGAGKSTVGQSLASALGWRFIDADAFHSSTNLDRLSRGEALSDADRAPWLEALRREIAHAIAREEPMVLACSALRRSYRETLLRDDRERHRVCNVYQRVGADELARRLRSRVGHFAPVELLQSQLETLEEPAPDEGALTLDGELPVLTLVRQIRRTCGS